MGEHRDKPIADRADDASRHLRFGEIENGVDRDHDKVELGQNIIIKIKRSVAENVAFDTAKQTEAIKLLVQCADRRHLCAQFCFV